jgi:hypothetical protein
LKTACNQNNFSVSQSSDETKLSINKLPNQLSNYRRRNSQFRASFYRDTPWDSWIGLSGKSRPLLSAGIRNFCLNNDLYVFRVGCLSCHYFQKDKTDFSRH